MDPLSKGTLVVATSFFDMKFRYHMVYHFLFKRARGAHTIIISHTYNHNSQVPTRGTVELGWLPLRCRSPLPEHHRLAALVLSVLDQIATC